MEKVLRDGNGKLTNLLDEVGARVASESDDLINLVPKGRGISISHKTSTLRDLTRVTPNEIKGRAIILVEDTPGLNNLDWQVNVFRSLDQAPELNIGELYRVSRMNIAEFRPDMVIVSQPVRSGDVVISPARYIVRYTPPVGITTRTDNKSSKDSEPEVYILRRR